MLDDKEKDASFARFDMTKPPCKQSPFLMPLIWALTLPAVKKPPGKRIRTAPPAP